ncbi:MAG: hypothetical protein QGG40_21400, partial [Myxococcota bacterium]|nr:hypothetical protein [Myxococcota bacterium]
MSEQAGLTSLLTVVQWSAAVGSAVALRYALEGMFAGAGLDWITAILAASALLLGPVANAMDWGTLPDLGWPGVLGALVLLGCSGAWSVGNVDSIRTAVVRADFERGGRWEIGTIFDLLDSNRGPGLLSSPSVTDTLRARLEPLDHARPDDVALWFVGLRLQGRSAQEILDGEGGQMVWLGMLGAEADPPAWWARAPWIAEALDSRPEATFQLGLLDPEAARQRGRSLWDESDHDQLSVLLAFREIVRIHVGILDRSRLDQLAKVWREREPDMRWALEPSVTGRQQLGVLLDGAGLGQQIGVRVDLPDGMEEGLSRTARVTLTALFSSLGYRAVEGDQVQVQVTMTSKEFPRVSFARSRVGERVTPGGMDFDFVYFNMM